MALHTVAYTQTFATAQTDVDFPALADPSVTILNNHVIYPIRVKLMWAYAMALLVQRVRISTPSLKPVARPVISPVEQAAAPSSRPLFSEFWRMPININPVEEIQILYTTTTAGAERGYVVLTVGDGTVNVPPGPGYSVRATATFTPTANVWSAGALTMDDTLTPGRYSIIGMRCTNAGAVAARLIFPGAPEAGGLPQIRPGVIADQTLGSQGTRYFRWGSIGEFGQFESIAVPQLEIASPVPAANPEVIFDIVQVRQGMRLQ